MVNLFLNLISSRYLIKIKQREERMPGFSKAFFFPRLIKTLCLLPTTPFFIFYFLFISKSKTILYRPQKNHRKFLENFKNILVVGDLSDKKWAKDNGYKFLYFYPIYCLSHLGLNFLWKFLLIKIHPTRVLIWTDFGLDQFLCVELKNKFSIKIWCIQHGLFPFKNNHDLDGYDCDINIVSSKYQKEILRNTGYSGKIIILNSIFNDNNKLTQSSKEIWQSNGKPIIFVGPGYSYNKGLELKIVNILIELQKVLPSDCKLIYRPHPRDLDIIKKLIHLQIQCINDKYSSYQYDANIIFIGVKSTFLVEAQNYGKKVLLLKGGIFPQYFAHGEIEIEIDVNELHTISKYLEFN